MPAGYRWTFSRSSPIVVWVMEPGARRTHSLHQPPGALQAGKRSLKATSTTISGFSPDFGGPVGRFSRFSCIVAYPHYSYCEPFYGDLDEVRRIHHHLRRREASP